jgi:hypothetical protein
MLNVSPPGWFASNPSILQHNDGFICVLKCVNFDLEEIYFSQNWQAMRPSERLSFRNLLVSLDKDLNVVHVTELDDSQIKNKFPWVSGLEDLRLLLWHGELWVLGSALDWKFIWSGQMWVPHTLKSKMFLSRLENSRLNDVVVFDSLANELVEKNWIAAVDERDNLIILPCLGADGRISIPSPGHLNKAELFGTEFRWSGKWSGSSPLLRVGNQYIAIIHRKTTVNGMYEYSHMFIQTEAKFKIQKRSDVFTFENSPVEFNTGLALSRDNRWLYISYGVMDKAAMIAEFRLDDVLKLINVETRCSGDVNEVIPDQRTTVSEIQQAVEARTRTIGEFFAEIDRLSGERESLTNQVFRPQ